MSLTESQIGELIIDQIISSSLFRVVPADRPPEEVDDGGPDRYVVVWSANAPEQIGMKAKELFVDGEVET